MKKLILIALFSFWIFAVNSQPKLTRNNLIGQWTIAAMQMMDMYYYDFEKDSLAFSETFKEGKDTQELASMSVLINISNDMFSKTFFRFNADGTSLSRVEPPDDDSGTYTFDEKTSVLIIKGKDQKTDSFIVTIIGNKLRLSFTNADEGYLLLKKKKNHRPIKYQV